MTRQEEAEQAARALWQRLASQRNDDKAASEIATLLLEWGERARKEGVEQALKNGGDMYAALKAYREFTDATGSDPDRFADFRAGWSYRERAVADLLPEQDTDRA